MSLTFLSELFKPYESNTDELALCEIRTLGEDAPAPVCFGMGYLQRAADYAKAQAADWDVYVGVLPRSRKPSAFRGGSAQDVSAAAWLWCDIDAGQSPQSDVTAFLRVIAANFPSPRMIVLSGSGGTHLYWRLDGAESLRDEAARGLYKFMLQRLVATVQDLSSVVKVDPACAEIARVLRVPNTFNHKRGEMKPVRGVINADAPDMPLKWWDSNLRMFPPQEIKPRSTALKTQYVTVHGKTVDALPAKLIQLASIPIPQGERHRKLVGCAIWALRESELPENLAREFFDRRVAVSHGSDPLLSDEIEKIWRYAAGA